MDVTLSIQDEDLLRVLEAEARRRNLTVERLIPVLITSLFDTGMAFAEPFHRMRQEVEHFL
jgi:hypothetical protein